MATDVAYQRPPPLSGWLGSYWSSMAKADFFVMIAAIAGVAGLVIWAFNKPLRPALGG